MLVEHKKIHSRVVRAVKRGDGLCAISGCDRTRQKLRCVCIEHVNFISKNTAKVRAKRVESGLCWDFGCPNLATRGRRCDHHADASNERSKKRYR